MPSIFEGIFYTANLLYHYNFPFVLVYSFMFIMFALQEYKL